MPVRRSTIPAAVALAGLWLALVASFAAFTIYGGLRQAARETEEAGRALHRMMSQRAAQHDAHLTSLGALATAASPPPLREFDQVATSIIRFYPRVTAIDLIALPRSGAAGDAQLLASIAGATGTAAAPAMVAQAVEPIARGAAGFVAAESAGRYRLVKKSSDDVALSLEIDAGRLFDAEEAPAWASLRLTMHDRPIVDIAAQSGPTPSFGALRDFAFEAELASASQPFRLTLQRRVALSEALSPAPLLLFALGAGALLGLAALGWRQRRVAIAARLAADEALQRERLQKHDAQLAHALRVNTMGEMASGIAHELNQPLTALLSQSQAGQRLAAASGLAKSPIAEVLAANVRQAKRAADILSRLRAYVSNKEVEPHLCDLNAIATDIAALSHIDLERRGIALDLSLSAPPPIVRADPVQIEQIIHNLIRNSADALDRAGGEARKIALRTSTRGGEAIVDVVDNGPGVAPDALPRLFEPFFSTKADGMGLGLPLCERIAERFGGRIAAANSTDQGAVFTLKLPLAGEARRHEAAE